MLPTLIGDWGIMNHLNDTQLVCQTLTGFNEDGSFVSFRLCFIQLGNPGKGFEIQSTMLVFGEISYKTTINECQIVILTLENVAPH